MVLLLKLSLRIRRVMRGSANLSSARGSALSASWGWGLFLLLVTPSLAGAAEVATQSSQDFPVTQLGELSITNLRGSIEVTNWAQDKIRVLARKRVKADSAEQARAYEASARVFHARTPQGIEIKAEYGRGLDLAGRLKERRESVVAMDLLIQAPSVLKLRALSRAGEVSLKGWKGSAELKTQSGKLRAENIAGKDLTLWCEQCSASVRKSQANLHGRVGEGRVELFDFAGERVFVEGKKIEIFADHVRSPIQIYTFARGRLLATELDGQIEFSTREGDVEILQSQGAVLGRSETGKIKVELRKWSPKGERDFIESIEGSIDLKFPENFEGQVDLKSDSGQLEVVHPAAVDRGTFKGSLKRGWSRRGLNVSSKKGRVRVSAFSHSG